MSEIRIHRLTWVVVPPTEGEVNEALAKIMESDKEAEISDRLHGCWAEWDHHKKHLAALSREWPGTTFTLEYQGIQLPDRHREQHRNGRVQHEDLHWENTGFDPDKPDTGGGPGTMEFGKLNRTSLPEHPGFRCSGAEAGFDELESVHFQDDTGAIFEPEDLWYAELVDEEYQIEGSGFLCQACLEAAGLTAAGRPTLLEEMDRRA